MLKIPFRTTNTATSSASDDRSTETNESIAITNVNVTARLNVKDNKVHIPNNNSIRQRIHSSGSNSRITFWRKTNQSISSSNSICSTSTSHYRGIKKDTESNCSNKETRIQAPQDDDADDGDSMILNNVTTTTCPLSTSLCVGNFTPLNDSTERKLDTIIKAQTIRRSTSDLASIEHFYSQQPFQHHENNTIRRSFSFPNNRSKSRENGNRHNNSSSKRKDIWRSKNPIPSAAKLLFRAATMCSTTTTDSSINDEITNDALERSFKLITNNNNQPVNINTTIHNKQAQQQPKLPLTSKNKTDSASGTSQSILVPLEDEPDIYGQIHPIENDTLIEQSLVEFDKLWRLLVPTVRIQDALDSEEMCPNIVDINNTAGKEFKLQFLRCDSFRMHDAIERYVLYWTQRVAIFGKDRAFKPITMESLTDDERLVLSCKYISIINPPSATSSDITAINPTSSDFVENRRIIYVDSGNFVPDIMTKNNNMNYVRACWYLLHYLGNNCIETQKRGVLVILNVQRYGQIYPAPSISFFRAIGIYFKRCVPVRMSGFHIIHPPSYVKYLYPIICALLTKQRFKVRLIIHTAINNDTEAIAMFQSKYGICSKQIPTRMIGGLYKLNELDWIKDQIQNGR
jgi:CRAL/TRIO domain